MEKSKISWFLSLMIISNFFGHTVLPGNPSFPTKDGNHGPCGAMQNQPMVHQGTPFKIIFDISDYMMLAFIIFQGIIRLIHKRRREISFSAKLFLVSLNSTFFLFVFLEFYLKKKKNCVKCVCAESCPSLQPHGL